MWRAAASTLRQKTSRARSCLPICAHWAPWPQKTKAMRGLWAREVRTAATRAARASSSASDAATTKPFHSRLERRQLSV